MQAHVCLFPHCLCGNFLMGAKVVFSQKTCSGPRGRGMAGCLLTGPGFGTPWKDQHTLPVPCDLPSFFCPLADPHILFQLSNFPTCLSQPRGVGCVCPFPSLQAKLHILLQFIKLDLSFFSPCLIPTDKSSKQFLPPGICIRMQ